MADEVNNEIHSERKFERTRDVVINSEAALMDEVQKYQCLNDKLSLFLETSSRK